MPISPSPLVRRVRLRKLIWKMWHPHSRSRMSKTSSEVHFSIIINTFCDKYLFCSVLRGSPWFMGYTNDAERNLESAPLTYAVWALFWSRLVNETMFAKCMQYIRSVYTSHTVYTLYTLRTVYTLYTLYTLHALCTWHTLYTTFTMNNLSATHRWFIHCIQCTHCSHCKHWCIQCIQWIPCKHRIQCFVYKVYRAYNVSNVCIVMYCGHSQCRHRIQCVVEDLRPINLRVRRQLAGATA